MIKYTLIWWTFIVFLSNMLNIINADAQCSGVDSFSVSSPVCVNQIATFTNNSTGGADKYDFKWGDGSSTLNIGSTASKTHKYTTSGTYTVWLIRHFTSVGTPCDDSASITVVVNPATKPTAKFAYSPSSPVCNGDTISFHDSSSGHSLTYLWDFDDGSTSTDQNPKHVFTSFGTGTTQYKVKLTVTDYNGCSTDTVSQYITIIQSPEPLLDDTVNVFSPFQQCSNTTSSTSFTIGVQNQCTPAAAISSYKIDWGDGSSVYTAGSTFTGTGHTYSSLGIFSLTFTITDTNGCKATKIYTVINESNPSVGVSSLGATGGCLPQSFKFVLNATNVSHTTKFIWNFGDGTPTVTWDYTKALDTIQHVFTKTSCGNSPVGSGCSNCFVVSVQAINSCDTTTATVNSIKISDKPKANFTFSPNIGCANSTTITFTNTTTVNCFSGTVYKWFFGDGTTSTSVSPTHKFTKQGTFSVKLVATNSCSSDTIVKTIEIDSIPVANFTATPACAPAVVNFTNTSTGANITYSWTVTPSSGWSFTNSTSATSKDPQITFTTAGTYSVKLTVTNSCGSSSKTISLIIPGKPTVILSAIPDHCGSYTFTPSATYDSSGSTITSYAWSFTGGSPSSSSSASPGSVTYSAAGSYTITITATNTCGSSTASKTFTVNPLPNTNAGPDTSVCSGGSIAIGSSSTAGHSYSWSPTTGLSSSTVSKPTATPASSTTYILTETITATGCSKKDTVVVTVNPLPDADAGSNKSICLGSSATIGAASVSGSTYSWSPSTGLNSSTISNPAASPTVTTTYTVTETITATGCSKSNSVQVTVNPLPTVNVGSNQSICLGQSVTIGSNAVSGNTYLWYPSTGLSSATAAKPTANPSSTTTYKLKVTNGNGCTDSDSVVVTVNPLPDANVAADKIICAGQSVSIGAASVSGSSYSWSPSTGLSSAVVSNPAASPATTTTYTLTETISATGCKNSNAVKVTVNPLPSANTGSDVAICTGSSTVIGAASVSGNTYSWSPGTGLSSSTVSNPTASPVSTTTYTLTETISATGCSKADTVVVTVNPLPTPSVSGATTVCAGDSQVYATTSHSGNSYTWVVQGGSIYAGSGTNSISVVWGNGSSGRIRVLEKVGSTSCQDSAWKTITINPQPSAGAGADKTICAGDSVQIGAASVSGDTYLWSPSTGLSSASISNPYARPSSTTTYSLTETITATGCKKSNPVKVTVNPLPAAAVGTGKSICFGQSTVIGSSSVTGSTYLWTPSSGLSSATSSNPTANPSSTTTYTLTETNSNGCENSDSVVVTVNPLPNANAGSDKTICAGDSVQIGSASVSGSTYSWSPSTGLSDATISNPEANPSSTTTYTLTETITATGCSKSNAVKVTVNPLPAANAGTDDTICTGSSVVLGAAAVSGNTYSWSPSTALSSTTASNPTAHPTASTTYTLKETVSATGCFKSDSVVVTVNPLPAPSLSGAVTVCAADSQAYSTANHSGNSYTWVVQGGSIVSGSGTNSIIVVWGTGSSGRVRVLEKVGSTSCQDSAWKTISINPQPNAGTGANKTICAGDSVQIGTTALSGDTYSWSPSTGLSSVSIADPMAKPSVTTTYSLTETISATGCKKTNTVKVTVNPLPAAGAGSGKTICLGQSTIIGTTAVAGSTYSWSPSTGLSSSSSANPTATPLITTTYTLTETNSKGCIDSNKVILTVNPLPGASVGLDKTICRGDSAQIGATPVGGNTYSWSPATGLSNASVANPKVSPSSTTTYTLTETITASGCSKVNAVKVTVNPLPSANTGADDTICLGSSVTIGSGAVIGNTYSWTPSTGLSSASVANPTASPTITTTYTLTEKVTTTGCNKTDSIIIYVNPLPTPSVSGPATVCAADSQAYSTTNHSGNTYTWTVQGGTVVSGSGTNSVVVLWGSGSTGRVSVLEKVGSTSCRDSAFKVLSINPQPNANAGTDKIICLNDSVQIGAAPVSGHTWSWSPSTGLSGVSVSDPIAKPSVTTTYTLTETITATGCSKSNSVKVTVNSLPAADAGSDKIICFGQSVSIGAASVSGSSYLWSPATGLSSSSASNPTASPVVTTTYTLKETNAKGCIDSHTVKVTVNPLPDAVTGTAQTICSGDSVQIGSTAVSGHSYVWTPSTGLSSDSVSNPKASPGSTTTYSLKETITATGCSKTNTVKVTVNPLPSANAGTNDTICLGASVVIGGASVSGHSYLWSPSTALTSTTISNPTASPSSTITYTLTETITATGCKKSDTVVVTVNPLPSPSVSGAATVCAADSQIYGTTNHAGNSYYWVVQGGSVVAGSGTNAITVVWGNGTAGRVRVLEKVGSTSCQDSDFKVISINPQPDANTGTAKVLCAGYSIQIGSAAVSGNTYSWTPASGLSSATISGPIAKPSSTTIFTLTETISATGCKKSNTVKVTVNPLPAANPGSNKSICLGESTTIGTASVSGDTYSWTSKPSGFTSTAANPTVTPSQTTTYYLAETITATGCKNSDSIVVTVNPLPDAKPGASKTICAGQSTAIGSGAISGNTYSWTSSPSGFTSSSSNPAVSPATTTTFHLTETISATGCSKSDSVIVKVNPLPAANTGSGQTICYGESATIGASSVSGDTYAWTSNPAGFSSTSANPTVSPTATTIYKLTETITATGCSKDDSVKINVNPLPTPSIAGNTTVCALDSLNYSTTKVSGNTYNWVVQGGTIVSGSGTSSIYIRWGSGTSGRIRVLEKVGPTSCEDSDVINITIHPLPAAKPGSAQTICLHEIAQIGSGAVSGDQYSWTSNPSGFTSTSANPSVSPTTTTTYYLTETINATGCHKSDSVIITVIPLPSVSTGPADTFCNTSTTATLSGSPTGGTWKGKGVTGSGVFTPSAFGTGTDTLYYVYTNPLTGCKDSAIHIVNIVNPANVIAGPDDTVCISDADFQLKNFSPSGGTWTGTGVTATGTFSPSTAGAGTFTLTYTVGKLTCKVFSTKKVKVNPLPVVKAGKSKTFCLNDPVYILSGYSPSGGIWTGNGIVDNGKGLFLAKKAGAGSSLLTYTYTDPVTHCTGYDTVRFIVNPLPNFTISTDSFQCKGTPATFTSTSTNTAIYNWDFGDGTTDTTANPKHAYNNSGSFIIRLIATTINGCKDTLFSKIRIIQPPVSNFSRTPFSGPGPLSVTFKNLSSGEIDGYEWNFGNGDSTSTKDPGTEVFQQSDNGDTTYFVTLKIWNRCGISIFLDSVKVFPRPKARFGTDRDQGCTPFTVHFSNKSVGKPTSYFWDFGNGKTSIAKDPIPQVYTTDSLIRTYTITEVAINKYGTDTMRHIITVFPLKVHSFFNTSITSGCVPLSVQFTDYSKGSTFVSWDFGDSNVSAQQNPLHTFSKPGFFTVRQFVNDGCGFDTGSIQITVHPKPKVAFKSIPTCATDSMQFFNLSPDFSGSVWDFGDGTQSKLDNPKHVYAAPGKYLVTLTVQSKTFGCFSSATDTATVDSVPQAKFSATPMEGCHPLEVHFSNTGSQYLYYNWDFGDGNTSIDQNPDHTYKDSGVYNVTFSIVTRLGCTNSQMQTIVVFPYPVAKFTISPNPTCGAPQNILFTNQSIGANAYVWVFSTGKSTSNNSPKVTFDSTGTYKATLIAVNSFGCKDTTSSTFTIYPQPKAGFNVVGQGCEAKSIQCFNTSTLYDSFFWDFGDGISDSLTKDPVHTYSTAGSYTISLKVKGKGNCQDQLVKTDAIIIHPKPKALFSYQVEENPTTGWVSFAADTTGIATYKFYLGDGDSSNLPYLKHRYDQPGKYTVKLIVENKFGCTDTIELPLNIKYFNGLYVPNALAPKSGPPEERIFLPKGASLKEYTLQIYNTWGELLWENSDLNNGHPATGWDGNVNGNPMPQGVYVWKIKATFTNGEVWEGKDYHGEKKPLGSVTLIR